MAIGNDIVEISRIRLAAQRYPKFWQRVLTTTEEAYCRSRGDGIVSLAGRFAAKEAIMKCIGCGMDQLSFLDIEIINDNQGRPILQPSSTLKKRMEQKGVIRIDVSISHCREYATAIAMAIGKGR